MVLLLSIEPQHPSNSLIGGILQDIAAVALFPAMEKSLYRIDQPEQPKRHFIKACAPMKRNISVPPTRRKTCTSAASASPSSRI